MFLVLSASMALFFLYLYWTHSLVNFYQSAILFNLQVYPKYNSASNIPGNFLKTVGSGLYLFGTGWQLFPYDLSGSFNKTTIFLLSGTVSRLIVLFFCLGLLVKRKYLAPLIDYVEKESVDAGNSYYISPSINAACKEALK